MSDHGKLRFVGYCCAYCGLCDNNNRIPQRARQLQQSGLPRSARWLSLMYSIEAKQAQAFCDVLEKIANLACACRAGGGPPDCNIRQCAEKKGVEVCPQCNEYPCMLIQNLAQVYPMMIHDGERIQKIGLEEWIKEQEERAKRGVVYTDIRVRSVEQVLKEREERAKRESDSVES